MRSPGERSGEVGPEAPHSRRIMLRLHDTLSDEKRPFEPQDPNNARIYVCGPTVYDLAHLGHVRCYVVYDVLVRHLRETGTPVTYVRNYTDVDDKIIKRAAEKGEAAPALAARFIDEFETDMAALGNLDPDIKPKVSEHIDEIIALVEQLEAQGVAYRSEGDVYFSVKDFDGYGKLSHRDLSALEAGASERLDAAQVQRKKHQADFVLWKGGEHEGATWDSPFGRGRPGWHIECSAMSMKHLGPTLDLHGGGLDLVFPHHENEIAQSEAATGKPYACCWMHNGFVQVNKEKMGKSLGNFFTARTLFEHVHPEAIRWFVMTVHYRGPLNFEWETAEGGEVTGFPQLEEAEGRVAYLYETRRRLMALPPKRIRKIGGGVPPAIEGLSEKVDAALDDDLNMPIALAAISEFLKAVNELCDGAQGKKGKAEEAAVHAAAAGFEKLARQLGVGAREPREVLEAIRDGRAKRRGIDGAWVEAQIEARAKARADKDFAAADAVREALTAKGVELHDTPEGTRWVVLA